MEEFEVAGPADRWRKSYRGNRHAGPECGCNWGLKKQQGAQRGWSERAAGEQQWARATRLREEEDPETLAFTSSGRGDNGGGGEIPEGQADQTSRLKRD